MLVGLYGGGVQFYYQDSLINVISENENRPQFSIFPNPAGKSFSIRVLSNKEPRSNRIQIMNSLGQIVLNRKASYGEEIVRTEDFPSGVYFVSISDGDLQTVQRVVVIH